MNENFIKVSLSGSQLFTIVYALFDRLKRSPLFVEECLDVCSQLYSSILDTAFNKDNNAVR